MAEKKGSLSTHSAGNLVQITAGSGALNPRPRGLYIGVSGTMDVENEDGTTQAGIEVVAGATMPYQPVKITAITTAQIYAYYG